LINLEDKDLLFVKKEETEEDDQEEDESDDESSFEDEEEENYEELIETCIKSGIEKKTDIENILKEVFSLKDAIFEKTKAESNF
jgi:predicted transcriptional regulator